MASIRKRPTSKFWQAQIREPVVDENTGLVLEWRLIGRSTRQTDRQKAMAQAVKMEEAARHRVSSSSPKAQKLLAVLQDATEMAIQGRLSEPIARKLISDLYRESQGQELNFFTVEGWLTEWLNRKAAKVASGTLSLYANAARTFLKWLGDRAGDRLETISRQDIAGFHEHVHATGRTAKTANQYRKAISNALQEAVRADLLLKNPADGVSDLPEEDSVAKEPFSEREMIQLVKSTADPEWRTAILIGAYTGLRITNCTRLTWADVDMEKGLIRVVPVKQRRTAKRKKVLTIPLHPSLQAAFALLPSSDDPSAPLLPRLAKKTTGGAGGLDSEFQAIMEAAGIDRKVVRSRETGALRSVARKSFHSLRHAANSMMAEAGVCQELRREILGHASDAMNDRYTHLSDGTLKRAVEALPEL